MGERGGRLAQPHVVGQASAQPDTVEELQPPQPAPLVRAKGGRERGWHLALGERSVGQAAEQVVEPPGGQQRVGAWATAAAPDRGLGLGRRRQLGRQLEQLEGGQPAVIGAMSSEVLERATCIGATHLHPSPADLDEARPGLGRAAQDGFVDRLVVDDHLPVDERGGAEAGATVGRRGVGLRRAASAGSPPGELLGRHQIDLHRTEQLDRLERGGGMIDVHRFGATGVDPLDEPWRHQRQIAQRVIDRLVQQRQVPFAAGQLHGLVGIGAHLGERAPVGRARGVAHLDQFERQRPPVAVVGQPQPQPRAHHRLALGPPQHGVEGLGELVEGIDEVALVAEPPGWRLQRTHGLAQRPADGASGVAEGELPPGVRQRGPGDLVDERVEHGPGGGLGRRRPVGRVGHGGCDHRGHAARQGGQRRVDVETQCRPRGVPPSVAALDQPRQHSARAHEHLGELERRTEPGDRRARRPVERAQPGQTGQRGDVEPLAHHRHLAMRQEQPGHAHRPGAGGGHGTQRATDGRVQVAAVHGAAGLPGHHVAVEPRELEPGQAGIGSLAQGHHIDCTNGVSHRPGPVAWHMPQVHRATIRRPSPGHGRHLAGASPR